MDTPDPIVLTQDSQKRLLQLLERDPDQRSHVRVFIEGYG
jgi:Fe-S cluster assembly iron-binding protein IscA